MSTSPPTGDCTAIRIDKVEHYHSLPIYRLAYPAPTTTSADLRAREVEALCAIAEERFALVISLENLEPANDATPEAEAGALKALFAALGPRLVAVTRYAPESLESLVDTMLAHVQARCATGSEVQSDLPNALRRLHQLIDRVAVPTLTGP